MSQVYLAEHRGSANWGDRKSNQHKSNHRKRPYITRTFFQKTGAKTRRCGLSMDTSVFGVLRNLINIRRTS